MDDAERSSIEIKALLRRLHPKAGNHNDRLRRVTKFRNYVRGDGKNTPEFYDDDIPLLFLGSNSPTALLDEENVMSDVRGLLEACGTPSTEHENQLKRSAKHCMGLLWYLVIDYKELRDGKPTTILEDIAVGSSAAVAANPFALAFCSLTPKHYRLMRLDLHLQNDMRGGAKNEACELIKLLLTQHLTEDGEQPSPLRVEDILPSYKAQQAFDQWTIPNLTKEEQDKIKRNQQARENEIALRARQEQLANKTLGRISEEADIYDNEEADERDGDLDDTNVLDDENMDGSIGGMDDAFDDGAGGVLAGFQRRKKERQKELKLAQKAGDIKTKTAGPAVKWEDSQLQREQKAKAASAARAAAAGEVHETVRESQEAMKELKDREDERAKVLGRDPLGIRDSNFDLRAVQTRQSVIMEQALQEIDEGIHDDDKEKKHSIVNNSLMGNNATLLQTQMEEDDFKKRQAQKESLMAIVDRLGGMDQLENPSNSVLFTEPNFDPMLFLSLVHLDVGYKHLLGSIEKLTNKKENKIVQLQDLVRDNFPLFVRCAEGIEKFNEQTATEVGPGVNERIDELEKLAEISADKAKKSFKPLLDNASEVRKVQSALAVLQRVAPILQAPFLMRRHVENRRYSAALKAYRRVLVIDENCTIELLNHVKYQATKYLHETRKDLERSLVFEKQPIHDLLHNISDLSELLELHVPRSYRKNIRSLRKKNNNNNSGGDISESDTDTDDSDMSDDDDDNENKDENKNEKKKKKKQSTEGIYLIGLRKIDIRKHPPPLACLLIQAAHFDNVVRNSIKNMDATTKRILSGERINSDTNNNKTSDDAGDGIKTTPSKDGNVDSATQWKYDTLDARVTGARDAVDVVRTWLPRLLRIGKAAREDEKRKAARVYGRKTAYYNTSSTNITAPDFNNNSNPNTTNTGKPNTITAFDVFSIDITPTVQKIVEHAAFCALGCPNRSGSRDQGKTLAMTFGEDAPEKLRAILRSPLPPSQSTRVDTELAELVDILSNASHDINMLRADFIPQIHMMVGGDDLRSGIHGSQAPGSTIAQQQQQQQQQRGQGYQVSPLEECKTFCEAAVITIEKRRCIFAFEVCARTCSSRAAGSGKFDSDALLNCLHTLSEKLTRPEECTTEVESGCELVVRRCCEGLASYVRDRGDSARLSAVSECADVMDNAISDVVREASYLTNNVESIEEVLMEDIMGLEGAMFDEYLESIKDNVSRSVKVGWLDMEYELSNTLGHGTNNNNSYEKFNLTGSLNNNNNNNSSNNSNNGNNVSFPPYLSASLLAIVRCRAQVEQALGNRIRKSENNNVTYQHLAMATVADSVVEGICNAINIRKNKLKMRQADRLANELQFLLNTLRKFLSHTLVQILESTRYMLYTIAGRPDMGGGGIDPNTGMPYHSGGGPDGLAALEDLERLGRVYLLCLGE